MLLVSFMYRCCMPFISIFYSNKHSLIFIRSIYCISSNNPLLTHFVRLRWLILSRESCPYVD